MNEEIHCVWNMGTKCAGKICKQLMFNEKLEVPICEKHIEEHKEVMILQTNGFDIEEIVDMKPEERKRTAYTIILAGLDVDSVIP